jgi:hypothetical protein
VDTQLETPEQQESEHIGQRMDSSGERKSHGDCRKESRHPSCVSVDENWATVRRFFDGKIPEGVVRDATGAAKRAYSVETLPETYVLHSGAILSARIRGARDWAHRRARKT